MSESEYTTAQRYGAALVGEIRAEMARREIRSVRALAEMAGMNHATLNSRLNRDPRTKERVALGQEDLWRIAEALEIDPLELVRRAAAVARSSTSANPPHKPHGQTLAG